MAFAIFVSIVLLLRQRLPCGDYRLYILTHKNGSFLRGQFSFQQCQAAFGFSAQQNGILKISGKDKCNRRDWVTKNAAMTAVFWILFCLSEIGMPVGNVKPLRDETVKTVSFRFCVFSVAPLNPEWFQQLTFQRIPRWKRQIFGDRDSSG